jgi:DNA polymerase IV
MNRLIVHLDMDAFFASIEQRDDPRLRGKPVIIGADPRGGRGRGVVSTCSYEARKFGVRSAMPISRAWRLCPRGCFLPVHGEKYARESEKIFSLLSSFTPLLEQVSIDEAYMDITGTYRLFGSPREACMRMKQRIREETGLTASVGLAPTKMAAKIASDLKKPDGLVIVEAAQLRSFLRPLETGKIWGLGPKAQERLRLMGIRTVGELADSDPRELAAEFGRNGIYFRQAANGVDDREVEAEGKAKSISAETTFEKDTADRRLVEAEIAGLCERVSRRMRLEKATCRTVTLKIRYEDFTTHTRAGSRDEATNFAEELIGEAQKLFRGLAAEGRKIRLVGVKATLFAAPEAQLALFGSERTGKKEKVHEAVDKIKDRFGEEAISRASSRRGNR